MCGFNDGNAILGKLLIFFSSLSLHEWHILQLIPSSDEDGAWDQSSIST